MSDDARDRAGDRVRQALVLELPEEEQRPDDHEHPGHVLEDLVDAGDELGVGEREPARFGRELARVRVAADRGGLEPSTPGDDDGARQHGVTRVLEDRIRLPGQQGLVELQLVRGLHPTVGGHLVAGTQLDQVVQHHRFHRNLGHGSVAHDPGHRCAEHREVIQRALRPVLLDDADQRVADEDEPEEAVGRRSEDQDQTEHGAENRVEPREDVRPDDLGERPGRPLAGVVRRALARCARRLAPRSGPAAGVSGRSASSGGVSAAGEGVTATA